MIFSTVNSSDLAGVAVNGNNLVIMFRSGGIYEYADAAVEFFNIMNASSKGKYFHQNIKPYYRCRKIR